MLPSRLVRWFALGLIAAGCAAPTPEEPASVLFVTIDTLRPDHLGAYGHPDARTPHLDALSRVGALFPDVRVPYPLTLPSHCTLLTGELPYRHGARRNDSFNLDVELPSLPTVFADQGRATGAIVSTFVLSRSFGLDRWFGTYEDLSDQQSRRNERPAPETTDWAIDWLDARPDSSFLLWAHYFDPHDDYEPPGPWDRLYAGTERSLYDGEIAFTDRELGRLLRNVEERGHTIVAVTSDHGEAFGEHGEVGHGYFLYDTTVRVPLIFARYGAETAGSIHPAFARSIDVFPTLCALAGVPAPAGLPGRDLDPLGSGPGSESVEFYLETFEPTVGYGATDLRAVVSDDWKWIEAPTAELYSLDEDPHELENLESAEPDIEDRLRAILATHLEAEAASGRAAESGGVDEETRDRLMALGYLTSSDDDATPSSWNRRDPKEIVHLIPKMFLGIKYCRNDEWDEGVRVLREVLEEDPINGKALQFVANSYMREGDVDGALQVYRDALAYDERNADILNQIGVLSLRSKRSADAVVALSAVVEIDPTHVAGWLNLASAYMQERQPAKAREAVRRALAVDPNNPTARQIGQRIGILPAE